MGACSDLTTRSSKLFFILTTASKFKAENKDMVAMAEHCLSGSPKSGMH